MGQIAPGSGSPARGTTPSRIFGELGPGVFACKGFVQHAFSHSRRPGSPASCCDGHACDTAAGFHAERNRGSARS